MLALDQYFEIEVFKRFFMETENNGQLDHPIDINVDYITKDEN